MQLHSRGQVVRQQPRGATSHAKPAGLVKLPRQLVRLTQRNSRCLSTAAEGGDVVRPNAQAAAPVSPPPVAGAAAGNNSSSQHAASGHSAATPSSSSSAKGSYSEFYKALNSTQYGLAAGGFSAGRDTPSNGTGASTQSHHHQPQQQLDSTSTSPPPPPAAAAAVGDGAGSSTVPSTAISADASQEQQPQQPSPIDSVGVEDAIKKAQEALAAAESSLSSIHKLRSAQPPGRWSALLQVAKSLATAAAAGALLVASHAFGLGWQWAGATIGALALAGERCRQYRSAQRRPHSRIVSAVIKLSVLHVLGGWVGRSPVAASRNWYLMRFSCVVRWGASRC